MSSRIPPGLRLYVAGGTPAALKALESRSRLLEALGGRVDIEVVDILTRPAEAETAGILATPTLSDESLRPPRRIVGDLSDTAQVIDFFGLHNREADA
jgi:circadian clock protein KaiB